MSLVQRTHMARLVFQDNDLARSSCSANLATSVSPASGLSFLTSWRGVVSALSSAVCVDSDLLIRWAETQYAGAGASSDTKRHGVFIFQTAMSDLAVVRVPSIDLALLETSGPFAGIRIDQAQPDVSAFVAAITGGLSGVQPCDPFVNDLTLLSEAYKEQF